MKPWIHGFKNLRDCVHLYQKLLLLSVVCGITECEPQRTQKFPRLLKTPEEAQGKFIGEEHGGTHWEASDSVY